MDGVQRAPDHEPAQLPLELEAAKDPVPYALTAKARRAVAPDSLPDLAVVGDDVRTGDDDVGGEGTDRARARALRRAGLEPSAIAAELRLDEAVVADWVHDVAPVHTARRRLRAVADADQASLARTRTTQAFERARQEAAAEAEQRLSADGAFATGLGLVAGIAEVTPHAVILTSRDPEVAATALRWLRSAAEVPRERIRVALRVAPQVAGDLAAHRWAETLDIDVATVTVSRWSQAPDAEAVRAMIRVSGPAQAGQVAGWRDVLMRTLGRQPE